MLPFGQTVRRWRQERGLTQADLAKAAGVPRPNLSRIESGSAEVSLRTLRSLAWALGVTPGTLADGRTPAPGKALSRSALERIAAGAVHLRTLRDARENALAVHLRSLLGPRMRALGRHWVQPRRQVRRAQAAWLALADHTPEVARSLLQRAQEQAGLR
jgi:transcriptional regulator with XRE-family HTH domain